MSSPHNYCKVTIVEPVIFMLTWALYRLARSIQAKQHYFKVNYQTSIYSTILSFCILITPLLRWDWSQSLKAVLINNQLLIKNKVLKPILLNSCTSGKKFAVEGLHCTLIVTIFNVKHSPYHSRVSHYKFF